MDSSDKSLAIVFCTVAICATIGLIVMMVTDYDINQAAIKAGLEQTQTSTGRVLWTQPKTK